ncbi:hypothetical protein KKA87_10955 [bacterium]|nr:hypothetical protein [bacterium]
MEKSNKSAEELEKEKAEAEAKAKSKSEPSEEEVKLAAEKLAAEEAEAKAKADEEEDKSTVPLADFTRTKEILWRMTKDIVDDEDKLAELAESDPKRLERLKVEFPKLFKDVKIPAKHMSDEDIEARIEAAVAKRLTSSGKAEALKTLQKELKMTDMEFLDIKGDLDEKAERLMNVEMASDYSEAVMLAYKNLNPKKYKELVQTQAVKELSERKENSKTGSGQSKGNTKFSQVVMDNYLKLGFSSPQEMVDYQDPKKMINIAV